MAAIQQFCSPTVGLSGQILRHAHHDTGGGGGVTLSRTFPTRISYQNWDMEHQELSFTLLTDLKKGREERKKDRKGKGRNATFFQRKTSSVASRAQAGRPAGRPQVQLLLEHGARSTTKEFFSPLNSHTALGPSQPPVQSVPVV